MDNIGDSGIVIYQTEDGVTQIDVRLSLPDFQDECRGAHQAHI